jgi:hypothetical protein
LSTSYSRKFDSDLRLRLAEISDVLVPRTDLMPEASATDVHREGLDEVLAARPDLIDPLTALLKRSPDLGPERFLGTLWADDRGAFDVLATVVFGAYYANPTVRRLIGYPGQGPVSPLSDESETDLGGGLLDPVIARGPIYRSPPAQ